ncbi:MAG: phosphatase PAP2 family protein [Chloroflexi bacterium]|nr:phosphatase PAP2 family protein [Chloroflexota bacterium]
MIHLLELPVIEALQGLGQSLQPLWLAITFLGDETFYLLFMPLLYWCVDAFVGLRVGVMLLFSAFGNGFLKLIFKSPRPFWVSDKINAGAEHYSFGLPSGHAMNSAAVWGWTAREIKRPWAYWAMGILIFLIGFSRIVLGVHFISDVLLGWLLGALLVLLFARNVRSLGGSLSRLSLKHKLALVVLTTALMISLPILVKMLSSNWQVPVEWTVRVGEIDPMTLDFSLTVSGLWFGMLAGFSVLLHQRGVLQSNSGTWQKVARYFVGLVGVVGLYAGLGAAFPDDLGVLSMVLRFVRYSLIGLWIVWGSPLVFEKLRIGVIKPYIPPQSSANS